MKNCDLGLESAALGRIFKTSPQAHLQGSSVVRIYCESGVGPRNSQLLLNNRPQHEAPRNKLQLNPDNSNCQGKLKLLRVIGVSSYRGFEQKDQKHLIKPFCLYMFYCKISCRCKRIKATKQNKETKQKHEILFLFAGKNCQNCLFTDIQTCDFDKGQFVIIYK